MIRVLHVVSDTNIGGAGMHLQALILMLDKQKFELFAACPRGSRVKTLLTGFDNIIELSCMHGDSSFDVAAIRELSQIIRKHTFDIVHTHGSFSARIAARLTNTKVIFTKHTPSYIDKKGNVKWFIKKIVNNYLCDRAIGVSGFLGQQLNDMGVRCEKIRVVHNGIDIQKFDAAVDLNEVRKDFGISKEFVIIQIARIEEIKGHKYLLQAVSELIAEGFAVKLLVVGDGSERQEMQALAAKLGISEHTIFTGFLEDIRGVLAVSDVVLLPSLAEALGIVLLEGMCMSKPCIASNVGGIPEVVENWVAGILVEPKDIQSIKNAIIALYKDPELRNAMGKAGRKAVLEKFSSHAMAKAVEEIYFELMQT